MSRLDSFIRRLEAQRACLELGARRIASLPGPVLELGLGHGRTYDHLRQVLPTREIYVFERALAADLTVVPQEPYLILGDIHQTLPRAAERFAGEIPLIHADIGTGDSQRNARMAGFISALLPRFLCPGGLVIADQDMRFEGALPVALPDGIVAGRYHLYRAT